MKGIAIRENWNDDSMLVLVPTGRLDDANAYTFDSTIMNHIANDERSLLVDLSHLDFISSAGLLVIRKAEKKLARRGGQIVLCGAPRWIREILNNSGLDRRIPVRGSRPAAAALLTELRLRRMLSSRRRWWSRVGDILRPVAGR